MTGPLTILFAAILLVGMPAPGPGAGVAQTTAVAEPALPADPALSAAGNLIGRALFLRGSYAPNNLAYDSTGRVEGTPKTTDWTLAAVNILKATRRAADTIELEGVRVAIRYNPDAHEFQRHPLNDEKMKLLVGVTPDDAAASRQINAAFAAIFSIGIDPALQRSMPTLWRHYFDPSLPWSTASPGPNSNANPGAGAIAESSGPPDPLASQTIYPIPPLPPLPGPPAQIVPPVLSHQTSSQYTAAARNDKVQGTVQLRLVVDAQGVPQRIAVNHPLGYGLDRQAADAVAKWRFNPALRAGQPVASAILVNIDFVTVSPR